MTSVLAATATSGHSNLVLNVPLWEWGMLIGVVATAILFDLFVLNRKHEVPTVRASALQTLMYVAIGAAFGVWMWLRHGGEAAGLYYATWLIEYSLSVDNVFVWSLILTSFAIRRHLQHRLLFWGIFGALAMRFIFISLGSTAITQFNWTLGLLGAFLIWTAWKLATSDDEDSDIKESRLYRWATKLLPVSDGDHGDKFFVRVVKNGKKKIMVTLFFVVLILVEGTDVLFAVDSVPAALAITTVTYIVFSSNAMAILGLRALYFLFDSIKALFSRLNEGLAIILGALGIKLILSMDISIFGWFTMPGWHPPTWLSLGFIGVVLLGSIVASRIWPEKESAELSETTTS